MSPSIVATAQTGGLLGPVLLAAAVAAAVVLAVVAMQLTLERRGRRSA